MLVSKIARYLGVRKPKTTCRLVTRQGVVHNRVSLNNNRSKQNKQNVLSNLTFTVMVIEH